MRLYVAIEVPKDRCSINRIWRWLNDELVAKGVCWDLTHDGIRSIRFRRNGRYVTVKSEDGEES